MVYRNGQHITHCRQSPHCVEPCSVSTPNPTASPRRATNVGEVECVDDALSMKGLALCPSAKTGEQALCAIIRLRWCCTTVSVPWTLAEVAGLFCSFCDSTLCPAVRQPQPAVDPSHTLAPAGQPGDDAQDSQLPLRSVQHTQLPSWQRLLQ